MRKGVAKIMFSFIAIAAAAAVALTVVLLPQGKDVACGLTSGVIDYSKQFEDITQSVKENEAVKISSSAGRELYICNDGSVEVKDMNSGIGYKTSSFDKNLFSDDDTENRSAFILEYLNALSRKETIKSYTGSVEKEQYRIFKNGDAVRVEYILGDNTAQEFYPAIISKERFESKLLANVNESDAEFLQNNYLLFALKEIDNEQEKKNILIRYPALSKHDIYCLSEQVNARIKNRLISIMKEVGYTYEDYLFDNKENMVGEGGAPLCFKIALEYRLDNGDLTVTVPKDSIEFYSDYAISSLSLFKFFTGVSDTEAKLFIPSGNGAVVSCDDLNSKNSTYVLPVYGENNSIPKKEITKMNPPDNANFPVYGMYSGNSGMLTIIESGESTASLNVVRTEDSAYVYPEFKLLENDEAKLTGSAVSYLSGSAILDEDIVLRYIFFENNQVVNYAAFAGYYRDYLEKNNMLPPVQSSDEPLLIVEPIGNVEVPKKLLGSVSFLSAAVPLTTFDEMLEMAHYFKDENINNIILKPNGWNHGGLYAQTPGQFSLSKKIGGESAYQKLVNSLQNLSIPLSMAVSYPYYYNDRALDGYSPQKDSARYIDKAVASLYPRSPVDWSDDTEGKKTEITSPFYYGQYTNRYLASKAVQPGYLAIQKFGLDINSDFNSKHYYDRTRAQREILSSLEMFKNAGIKLLSEDANAYMLPYVTALDSVAVSGAKNKIFSQVVPFKQMVLHGSIAYTAPLIPGTLDWRDMLLDCIETGSGLHVTFIQSPSDMLDATEYAFLNLAHFDRLKEDTAAVYQELNTALKGLGNQRIVNHDILADGVTATVFENGETIIVNHTEKDIVVNQKTIQQKSYIRY